MGMAVMVILAVFVLVVALVRRHQSEHVQSFAAMDDSSQSQDGPVPCLGEYGFSDVIIVVDEQEMSCDMPTISGYSVSTEREDGNGEFASEAEET
jgi:hypothetical protein